MRNRERLKSSPAGTEDGPQGTAGPQAVSLDFSLRCKKGTFLQKWFDFRLSLRSFPYSANSLNARFLFITSHIRILRDKKPSHP